MDISELEVKDIKALLYDQIVLLEQTRNNINVLQKELEKKSQEKGEE